MRLEGVVQHHVVRIDAIVEVKLDLFDDRLEIGPVHVAPVRGEHLEELQHLRQQLRSGARQRRWC